MINAEHIYINNFVMACYIEIPSVANTLEIITIFYGLYAYFVSTYYNDKGDVLVSIL